MSGYTHLTETEGDELAVRASDTIRERAQRASRANGGSMVKILGDGAMLHFPDVATALPAVVGLVDELTGGRATGSRRGPRRLADRTRRRLFRAHGQHRLTGDQSRGPGEVVVTDEVVEATHGGSASTPLPPADLKGISGPVPLYRASKTSGEPA